MKIDWFALGLVAVVTVATAAVVVAVFSRGIAALIVAKDRAGTSAASTTKVAAYASSQLPPRSCSAAFI